MLKAALRSLPRRGLERTLNAHHRLLRTHGSKQGKEDD
jgi:hypothetical protein